MCSPTPVGEAAHDQGGVEEDPVFGGLSPPVPIVCDVVRIHPIQEDRRGLPSGQGGSVLH